ncbi:MAG: NAD(P)-dependent alcohol dehydrogenase [Algoriphagus sp.]|uniref:NAD(P)-dependent alcohol dehydrogenase n=1 Tax=Algoriphagus sp. TaxID=1872435 RepID=UPI0026168AD9|nr:NAD(P)-dependent alcohol dehydrogenase [Algoriphagus sp.]MDG1278264.1 NAD(P)-dependent alcohol dehydrogenase [Algoriphagus sp.]
MKAQIYTQYGPPSVIRFAEIAKPNVGKSDVLIQVKAATVNRTDSGFRSAEYFVSRFFSGLFRPNQPVLGCEFAGVVSEIGSEVSKFKVGDRVFGFDDEGFGAHAEFKVIDENKGITTIPEGLDFETAAALSEGSHYALGNIRAANVLADQHVLVIGGTGAIGSAAIQLIKGIGAKVTAVCPGAHMNTVRNLGADRVVNFQTEDFTQTEERYEFIFDAVGKSRFSICKPLLKEKGIYISTELGPRLENIFLAIKHKFTSGKKLLFPIPTFSQEDLIFLKTQYEKGLFKPLIDRVYDFDQLVEAYTYVGTGQKIGNVILRIS